MKVYFRTVSECHHYIEQLKENWGITAKGIGHIDDPMNRRDGLVWYVLLDEV